MGAPQTRLLPELTRSFRAAFPGITLTLREMCSPDQVQALLAGTLDVGLLVLPAPHPALRTVALQHEELVAALPEGHPLAGAARLPVSALAQETLLTCTPSGTTFLPEQVAHLCHLHGLTPRTLQAAPSDQALVGLVAAGVGVAVVARAQANPAQVGVAFVPFEEDVSLTLGAATRKEGALPPAQAFWKGMVET